MIQPARWHGFLTMALGWGNLDGLDEQPWLASVTAGALNAFFNPDRITAGAQAAPLVVADHS